MGAPRNDQRLRSLTKGISLSSECGGAAAPHNSHFKTLRSMPMCRSRTDTRESSQQRLECVPLEVAPQGRGGAGPSKKNTQSSGNDGSAWVPQQRASRCQHGVVGHCSRRIFSTFPRHDFFAPGWRKKLQFSSRFGKPECRLGPAQRPPSPARPAQNCFRTFGPARGPASRL